jgi:hypothetical protein
MMKKYKKPEGPPEVLFGQRRANVEVKFFNPLQSRAGSRSSLNHQQSSQNLNLQKLNHESEIQRENEASSLLRYLRNLPQQ